MHQILERIRPGDATPPPITPAHPLQAVSGLRSTQHYRRGQEIYSAGEPADFWYHLQSGAARKYALLADGRRRIVDFLLPGDFFGFGARRRRNFAVEAIIPGTIVATYPRHRIEIAADGNPALGRWIRDIAFEAISRAQARVLITGRVTALEKVGSFLVEMGIRSFDRVDQTVVLPMSRYDIADYLGVSVETVSRALTGFKQRGAIRFVGPHRVRLFDRRSLESGRF